MTKAISIRGHFDGKVIIPDEPVNLPANRPLVIDIHQLTAPEPANRTADERRDALKRLIKMSAIDSPIDISKLKRDTDREDEGYGY